MAAESLENMAKKLGVSIKVETDGSGGAQNVLTKAEIDSAEAIIVAADKNVGMARFNGKPVIQVPVADGIHKAEELINRAVSGSVPVYHHQEDGGESSTSDRDIAVDRSICDRTSRVVWSRQRTAGNTQNYWYVHCPDWCCNFSMEIVQLIH